MDLRALGGLHLEGVRLARRKPLLLLCLLALDGPQDRRRLATLFWPEATDPRNRLSVALSRLRKASPGVVRTHADALAAHVRTDVEALEAALARADAAAVRDLYIGPFLARLNVPNLGEELEAWILQRREEIAGRVRRLWLREAEREAAADRFGRAAAHAEAALAVPGAGLPDPEQLTRMHTLLLAGDSSAAAALARDGQELDLRLVASQEDARSRLRGEPRRGNLPRPATSFVGRDHELAELGALLGDPRRPLITLLGPGGIGKTRLALALAADRAATGAFPGGAFFVPLEGLEHVHALPRAIAAALGHPPGPDETGLEAAAGAIGPRATLLVLDGMERVTAGVTQVAELIGRCPRLFVLVTSRVRLELEEESVLPLAGLPLPERAPRPADVDQHEAIRLFVERAQRVRLDYQPDQEEVAAILDIAHEVGGAPLGIELAAIGVRNASAPEIAASLRASFDAVVSRSRNVAERHRSLRASFEASWQLLTFEERDALRRVSVFRGGFEDEGAVERVCELPERALHALRDVSLLQGVPGERATLHPLVSRFAAERLAEDPVTEARLRARHAAWVLQRIAHLNGWFYGPQHAAAMAALEREEVNLIAAFDWAVAHDGRLARSMAGALRSFWRFSGRLAEGRAQAERALAAAPEAARAEGAAASITAGEMAYRQGAYERAHRHLEVAIASAERASSRVLVSHAREVAGLLAIAEHRLDEAEAQFRAAAEAAGHRGDDRTERAGAIGLGRVALARGSLDEAQARFERVLDGARQVGSIAGIAEAHAYLGAIARARGELDAAFAHLRSTLDADRELGDRGGIANTLQQLADVAFARGDVDEAGRPYAALLERCRALGDSPGAAKAAHGLGRVAQRRGRPREALERYRSAAHQWLEMGNHAQVRPVLWSLASLANAAGRFETAARLWGAEAALVRRFGLHLEEAARAAHGRDVAETRGRLDGETFDREWRRGGAAALRDVLQSSQRPMGTVDSA